MAGVDNRTKVDMDTTSKISHFQEDRIKDVIAGIISIDVRDGIVFEIQDINHIRKNDERLYILLRKVLLRKVKDEY